MEDKDVSAISGCVQMAARSTFYNIALQIILRVVTFVANACILRFVSASILGIINVRLMLLYTTIQFISREPFRRTLAPNSDKFSGNNTQSTRWQEIVRVNSLLIPWTCFVGFFASIVWHYGFTQPAEELIDQYRLAIVGVAFSTLIESMAESFYIFGQRNDFIRLKVVIEGIFQMTRCLTFLFGVYLWPSKAIFQFAISQTLASLVYSVCYVWFFLVKQGLPLSHFLPNWNIPLNTSLLSTGYGFFKNTILKQFLTEGERYIMTIFSVINFAEQGVYDVINNLGSLPARLVFQQIEESGYLMFSSIVQRDAPVKKQKGRIIQSLEICSTLVKLMLLVGLTLFVYGFNLASIVVHLYGGHNLTSGEYGHLAVRLFGLHCVYIIFIALNGILECYSFAAMDTRQLDRFTYKMFIMSFVFVATSLALTSMLGSQGFIVTNCLNMATRIVISLLFIAHVCAQLGDHSFGTFLKAALPRPTTLLSFVAIFSILLIVRIYIVESYFLYICLTGILTLLHLFLIYRLERNLANFVWAQFLSKRVKSD